MKNCEYIKVVHYHSDILRCVLFKDLWNNEEILNFDHFEKMGHRDTKPFLKHRYILTSIYLQYY